MNIEQLEQAKRKAAELIKFNEDNDRIDRFITELKETPYIKLIAAYTMELFKDERQAFDLVGSEIIELLEKKLTERRAYLEELNVDDLIGFKDSDTTE